MREYLAGIARQQTEELVFERREVNLLVVAPHAACRIIDAEAPVAVDGFVRIPLHRSLPIQSAQRHAHASQQLLD